jgi:glucosamine-6-phosphate deaminase
MNMLTTIEGTIFADLLPAGWDLERINKCTSSSPETITDRQDFWHSDFNVESVKELGSLAVQFGYEIAMQIKETREANRKLILILPVGPMEMYHWVIYFLKKWNLQCDHVFCFSMDEWSDKDGNTIEGSDIRSFEYAMNKQFYGKLGKSSIPKNQQYYSTKEILPQYVDVIESLRSEGAKQVLVYGIGRVCHIAFWEPHFAEDYKNEEEWLSDPFRIGAMLHPLTIEQNAYLTFNGNYIPMTCYANTVGPGIMFKSDYCIGGADGVLGRGMSWQGQSLWITLRYKPSIWFTSSFIPTLPGKLLFLESLAYSSSVIDPH